MIHDTTAPSARRTAVLFVVAVAAGAGLWQTPVGPSPDLGDLPVWWSAVDPATAAVTILRAAGLVLACFTAAWALLGLVVAVTSSAGANRLWTAVAPASVRRVVALSVLAAGLHATTAGAQVAEDRSVPLLIDLGPVDRSAASVDLPVPPPDLSTDSTDPTAEADEELESASAASLVDDSEDTWIVQRGEHLWAIAEETLSDRGDDTDDAAIADYWRQLIDNNRSVIGPDADLIHPGMVLTLPD